MQPGLLALLDQAESARGFAHAPYSRFTVGAALLAEDGSVVPGCNMENASYGASICAERVAMGAAIARGFRRFTAIAVAGPAGIALTPCGICRQVLREFSPGSDLLVVTRAADGSLRQTTLAALLPDSFGPDNLAAAIEPG